MWAKDTIILLFPPKCEEMMHLLTFVSCLTLHVCLDVLMIWFKILTQISSNNSGHTTTGKKLGLSGLT